MAERADRRRLDQILVDRGLAPSRARARALILAGRVRRGTERLDKPGAAYPRDVELVVAEGRRWVGRGALKLAKALETFAVVPAGRVAADIGASTGGFTQVLLEAGARHVVAVDVGRGQLDWGLRNDPRVTVLEGTNARSLRADDLAERPSLIVMDVSFISIEKILPALAGCLREGGEIVSLIKPQFEVGRGHVGKGGIVRDAARHREVLLRVVANAERDGWHAIGLCGSPIHGADGNREFFVHLRRAAAVAGPSTTDWERVVDDLLRQDPT